MTDDWTPLLLKEHFEALLGEFEKRILERFVTIEKANEIALFAAQQTTAKVEINLQKEIQNLCDRQSRFELTASTHLTQSEYRQAHEALQSHITNIREWVVEQRGKGIAASSIWAILAGIAAILITAVHALSTFWR